MNAINIQRWTSVKIAVWILQILLCLRQNGWTAQLRNVSNLLLLLTAGRTGKEIKNNDNLLKISLPEFAGRTTWPERYKLDGKFGSQKHKLSILIL
jgi:hypothetical protein